MPVCPRCHAEFESGTDRCAACDVSLLNVISDGPARVSFEGTVAPKVAESPAENDRLLLLLEEPLPEMAAMIREFLQNCGIRCIVDSESIGLLYRLPASMSTARVYVRESDYPEARELVAHFFRKT